MKISLVWWRPTPRNWKPVKRWNDRCCPQFVRAFSAIFLFGLLSGCGTMPTEPHRLAVGTLRLPAATRMVGLTVARPVAEFSLELPSSRQEVVQDGVAPHAHDPLYASKPSPLLPVAYVLGSVHGALFGTSESELKRAIGVIQSAVRDLQPDTRVAQTVAAQLNAGGRHEVRPVADNLPLEPKTGPGTSQPNASGRRVLASPVHEPHPLRDTEFDTLVGIRVSFLGFREYTPPDLESTGHFNQLMQEYNPPLALVLSVDVAAIRTRDWATLGGVTVIYESIPRRFMAWTDGEHPLLRHELDAGLQYILRELTQRISLEPPRQP